MFLKSGDASLFFEEAFFSGLATDDEAIISYSITGPQTSRDTSLSLNSFLGSPISYMWDAHPEYTQQRIHFTDTLKVSAGAFEDTFVRGGDARNFADSAFIQISNAFDSTATGDTLVFGEIGLINFRMDRFESNSSIEKASLSLSPDVNNTPLSPSSGVYFELWELEGFWGVGSGVNSTNLFEKIDLIAQRYSFTPMDTSLGFVLGKDVRNLVNKYIPASGMGLDPGFALINGMASLRSSNSFFQVDLA